MTSESLVKSCRFDVVFTTETPYYILKILNLGFNVIIEKKQFFSFELNNPLDDAIIGFLDLHKKTTIFCGNPFENEISQTDVFDTDNSQDLSYSHHSIFSPKFDKAAEVGSNTYDTNNDHQEYREECKREQERDKDYNDSQNRRIETITKPTNATQKPHLLKSCRFNLFFADEIPNYILGIIDLGFSITIERKTNYFSCVLSNPSYDAILKFLHLVKRTTHFCTNLNENQASQIHVIHNNDNMDCSHDNYNESCHEVKKAEENDNNARRSTQRRLSVKNPHKKKEGKSDFKRQCKMGKDLNTVQNEKIKKPVNQESLSISQLNNAVSLIVSDNKPVSSPKLSTNLQSHFQESIQASENGISARKNSKKLDIQKKACINHNHKENKDRCEAAIEIEESCNSCPNIRRVTHINEISVEEKPTRQINHRKESARNQYQSLHFMSNNSVEVGTEQQNFLNKKQLLSSKLKPEGRTMEAIKEKEEDDKGDDNNDSDEIEDDKHRKPIFRTLIFTTGEYELVLRRFPKSSIMKHIRVAHFIESSVLLLIEENEFTNELLNFKKQLKCGRISPHKYDCIKEVKQCWYKNIVLKSCDKHFLLTASKDIHSEIKTKFPDFFICEETLSKQNLVNSMQDLQCADAKLRNESTVASRCLKSTTTQSTDAELRNIGTVASRSLKSTIPQSTDAELRNIGTVASRSLKSTTPQSTDAELRNIGTVALRSLEPTTLQSTNADKLRNIGAVASRSLEPTTLQSTDAENLRNIGAMALRSLESTTLQSTNADKLRNIGAVASRSLEPTTLQSTDAENLRNIGAMASRSLEPTTLQSTNADKLRNIGAVASRSLEPTTLQSTDADKLRNIGAVASRSLEPTTLQSTDADKLRNIGAVASRSLEPTTLQSIDAENLRNIGAAASRSPKLSTNLQSHFQESIQASENGISARKNSKKLDIQKKACINHNHKENKDRCEAAIEIEESCNSCPNIRRVTHINEISVEEKPTRQINHRKESARNQYQSLHFTSNNSVEVGTEQQNFLNKKQLLSSKLKPEGRTMEAIKEKEEDDKDDDNNDSDEIEDDKHRKPIFLTLIFTTGEYELVLRRFAKSSIMKHIQIAQFKESSVHLLIEENEFTNELLNFKKQLKCGRISPHKYDCIKEVKQCWYKNIVLKSCDKHFLLTASKDIHSKIKTKFPDFFICEETLSKQNLVNSMQDLQCADAKLRNESTVASRSLKSTTPQSTDAELRNIGTVASRSLKSTIPQSTDAELRNIGAVASRSLKSTTPQSTDAELRNIGAVASRSLKSTTPQSTDAELRNIGTGASRSLKSTTPQSTDAELRNIGTVASRSLKSTTPQSTDAELRNIGAVASRSLKSTTPQSTDAELRNIGAVASRSLEPTTLQSTNADKLRNIGAVASRSLEPTTLQSTDADKLRNIGAMASRSLKSTTLQSTDADKLRNIGAVASRSLESTTPQSTNADKLRNIGAVASRSLEPTTLQSIDAENLRNIGAVASRSLEPTTLQSIDIELRNESTAASRSEKSTLPESGKSLTDYTIKSHKSELTVKVNNANITELLVDVIVSACNSKLKPLDRVGEAIFRVAGRVIADECEEYIAQNNEIEVSHHFVSCAGNLYAKQVYHACIPVKVYYVFRSELYKQDLRLLFLECLVRAEQQGHQSVAFPLSVGGSVFSRTSSAVLVESYMKVVQHFENWRSQFSVKRLQDVYLVDNDVKIVNKAEEYFLKNWEVAFDTADTEFRQDLLLLQSRISNGKSTALKSLDQSGQDTDNASINSEIQPNTIISGTAGAVPEIDQAHQDKNNSHPTNDSQQKTSISVSSIRTSHYSQVTHHPAPTRKTTPIPVEGLRTVYFSPITNHPFTTGSAVSTISFKDPNTNRLSNHSGGTRPETTIADPTSYRLSNHSGGTRPKTTIADPTSYRLSNHSGGTRPETTIADPTSYRLSNHSGGTRPKTTLADPTSYRLSNHSGGTRPETTIADPTSYRLSNHSGGTRPETTIADPTSYRLSNHSGGTRPKTTIADPTTNRLSNHSGGTRPETTIADPTSYRLSNHSGGTRPKTTIAAPAFQECVICADNKSNVVKVSCCRNDICKKCNEQCEKCPFCRTEKRTFTGHMPSGTMSILMKKYIQLPGVREAGCYEITYLVPLGSYNQFTALIPSTYDGSKVLLLLIICFRRGLTFTKYVSLSKTSGIQDCYKWTILHKSSAQIGDQEKNWSNYLGANGFQEIYLKLSSRRVTFNDMNEEEQRLIDKCQRELMSYGYVSINSNC